jgi:hypothetical protein
VFTSVGSFRFEPRLSAENRHNVGLHGKSVAKISGVANDPMGGHDSLKGTCHQAPERAILFG